MCLAYNNGNIYKYNSIQDYLCAGQFGYPEGGGKSARVGAVPAEGIGMLWALLGGGIFLTLAPPLPLGLDPLPPLVALSLVVLFLRGAEFVGGGEAASEPAREVGRFFFAGGLDEGRCDWASGCVGRAFVAGAAALAGAGLAVAVLPSDDFFRSCSSRHCSTKPRRAKLLLRSVQYGFWRMQTHVGANGLSSVSSIDRINLSLLANRLSSSSLTLLCVLLFLPFATPSPLPLSGQDKLVVLNAWFAIAVTSKLGSKQMLGCVNANILASTSVACSSVISHIWFRSIQSVSILGPSTIRYSSGCLEEVAVVFIIAFVALRCREAMPQVEVGRGMVGCLQVLLASDMSR